eukprot:5829298-Prymnesium_polylepis.1
MVPFNWLFDPESYVDNTPRKFCPYDSTPGGAVGYAATNDQRYGRWGLARLKFDETYDNASQEALGSGSQPSQTSAMYEASIDACPTDPIATMRTETSTICKESYVASGQKMPFTSGQVAGAVDAPSANAPPLTPNSAVPKVRILDQFGVPMAGQNCSVSLEDPGDSMFLYSPYEVRYTCGPSDADGYAEIKDVSVDGGYSQGLSFTVKVGAIVATPMPDSPWRFDVRVFYLSTQQGDSRKVVRFMLAQNGTTHLLMLLSLFVLSLNAMSNTLGRVERAPMVMRFLGYVAMLWLVELNSQLFVRAFYPPEDGNGYLSAIGVFDMYAIRAGRLSGGAALMMVLTVILSLLLLYKQTGIWYSTVRRSFASTTDMVVHDMRKPVVAARQGFERIGSKMWKPNVDMEKVTGPIAKATDASKGFCGKVLDWCKAKHAALQRFAGGVPPVMDGLMEPDYSGETNAEKRARVSRNYVRKLLRGRAWVREQLFVEQENIAASPKWARGIRSFLFGVESRLSVHMPYERSNDFVYPERMMFAFSLSLW